MSRKPFHITNKLRDEMNPHFIWKYDEKRAEYKPKAQPLRGYMKEEDFKELAEAKEFLYSEHDVDKLEKAVWTGV